MMFHCTGGDGGKKRMLDKYHFTWDYKSSWPFEFSIFYSNLAIWHFLATLKLVELLAGFKWRAEIATILPVFSL